MGCVSSSPTVAEPVPKVVSGGYHGGKGKGQCKSHTKPLKWQVKLGNEWKDYEEHEDRILKRAYLVGQPNVKFHLRGQDYQYNFKSMKQNNLNTGKDRNIRPPPGPKPPKHPLLPIGPMAIVTVRPGQAGTMISVLDPNNKGNTINVFVPLGAKPGQKMAVPIPQKGESVQVVQKKQKKHDETQKKVGWSTGAKVAAGGSALVGVGAVGVGGVILGDALAGGDMAGDIAGAAVEAGEAIGDGVADAAETVADWAPGAAEDAEEFTGDAAGDCGAAEDVGDFIVDLF